MSSGRTHIAGSPSGFGSICAHRGLAVTEAERALPAIMEELVVQLARLGRGDERCTVRVTGCPDGCARPYNADVGLVGRSAVRDPDRTPGARQVPRPPRWPTVGDRFNVPLKDCVPADRVVAGLVPVFARFGAEFTEGETFGDFCDRVGVETLAGTLTPA